MTVGLYDTESGDTDAYLWIEEIVERTPAIVEGGAGGKDVIDEEYVLDVHGIPSSRGSVRRCTVKDFRVMKTPAKLLADRFWPGPLTMIMPKSDAVPYATTGGLDTVAIRMPSHPTAYELIRSSGVYIAAPSANTSGRPSPTTAQHVYEDLNGRIDMIIDSGKVDIGLESTIVDLTGEIPTILRPGYITKEMLEEAVGPVTIDKAILADHEDPNLRPKAPGMKYKHYAPKGDLVIVEGKKQAVAEMINHLTKRDAESGLKTAVIASEENLSLYDADCKINIGSREHEESIAANLYEVLREMDEIGVQKMYSESFAGGGLGAAIMNRYGC